jgi:hypothetical protein
MLPVVRRYPNFALLSRSGSSRERMSH